MEIDKNANELRGVAEPQKSVALSSALSSASELSQITTDIEAFMGLWMARLQSLLDDYGSSSVNDETLRKRTEEFEAAQRRWNEERRRDVEQIQETTEQLAAAWGRLEEEQRRILQAQEGGPQRAPAPRIASPAAPQGASEDRLEPGDAAAARERAVRQFQKLRRQIGLPTT